jgi:hypothetical protein
MQERKLARLCTCCADVVQVVEEGGKDVSAKKVAAAVPFKISHFECLRLDRTGLRAAESSFAASLTIWRNARTSALSGRWRG